MSVMAGNYTAEHTQQKQLSTKHSELSSPKKSHYKGKTQRMGSYLHLTSVSALNKSDGAVLLREQVRWISSPAHLQVVVLYVFINAVVWTQHPLSTCDLFYLFRNSSQLERKCIHAQFGRNLMKVNKKQSDATEMKQCNTSGCNLEAWLWHSMAPTWFHLLILCFHHTLQHDVKWRHERSSGSMRWFDHSLFAAACCAHMCVHMCTWQVFDCYACFHVCASFQSSLALASEFPSRHLPPNYCCRISIQVGSPVGWEKWACTSISLAWKCYFPKSSQFSCLVKQETPAVIWMNNLTW